VLQVIDLRRLAHLNLAAVPSILLAFDFGYTANILFGSGAARLSSSPLFCSLLLAGIGWEPNDCCSGRLGT